MRASTLALPPTTIGETIGGQPGQVFIRIHRPLTTGRTILSRMSSKHTGKAAWLALIAAPLLCALIFALWAYGRMEAYCFFNPDIDTEYAPGFSEQAFAQTTVGMLPPDVEAKLGKPLEVSKSPNRETKRCQKGVSPSHCRNSN
jgi:hypothetical protein